MTFERDFVLNVLNWTDSLWKSFQVVFSLLKIDCYKKKQVIHSTAAVMYCAN